MDEISKKFTNFFKVNKNFQILLDNNFSKNKKNENEWEIIIKWVIVVFDWVFFCWRVIYQFAKIVNGKLGTHSCHSTGCLHRGIILFCLNSWERRMQLRTSWFMLRVPPWCRKSQFRQKTTFVHPINLIKKTSLLV